jgi:TetR/AcrR family transcriptional regulator, regulator of cefoperazone and chloramphenicol sensitivity
MTRPAKTKFAMGRSACQDRSERTRQRLIEVAVEVFSELGFETASTRTIVERAQANLVSIPYYFGSKLGLYHAAAEYIGSNIVERFRPAYDRARQGLLESGSTHDETLRSFTEFIVEFSHIMLGADTPGSWGQFIYREQFDPTGAFDIIHAKFAPLLEVGFEYISRLTNRPADAPETRIQLMAIFSMVKFVRVDRASVLRSMGWKSFGQEETRIVENMLRHNMHALFARSA